MQPNYINKINSVTDEATRLYRDTKLDIIDFTHAKIGKNCVSHNIFPYNRMQMIISGKSIACISGKKYELIPGNIYIIPLNQDVRLHYEMDTEKIYSRFLMKYKDLDIFQNFKPLLVTKSTDELLKESIEAVQWRNYLDLTSLFYKLLSFFTVDIANLIDKKKHSYHEYEIFFDVCVQNLSKNIKISEVAGLMGLSKTYFIRKFKKKFGMTPKQYLLNEKIMKAKEYLLFSNLQIKEISDMLGFTDQFYFYKIFKKYNGQGPEAFRKKRESLL